MSKFCPFISQVMMLPGKIAGSAEIQLIGMPCQGLACLAWDPAREKCSLIKQFPKGPVEVVDNSDRT